MNCIVTVKGLLLAGVLTAGLAGFASQGSAQSLGEVAKQNKPKDAKVTTKRVFTDDDLSHSAQPIDPSPKSGYVSDSDIEAFFNTVAEKTPRQLGEAVVPGIKFPERSQWEDRLYAQKEKMAAAARACLDVQKSGAKKEVLALAKSDFDWEVRQYEKLRLEGLAKAAEWERQTRR